MARGVYTTTQKNGNTIYRVSITHKSKHISLGTYTDYQKACSIYTEGRRIIEDTNILLEDFSNFSIPHNKFVSLVNFRDNGLYFANPIYLRKQYFEYYLSPELTLKFDRDDLFFYASHKIQQRGGYLFVCDYGSQYKILSRYGIRPFAVYGRDYIMVNGDTNDYRYSNIMIINNYNGVSLSTSKGKDCYTTTIHIKGNYIVGRYSSEQEAAIAYNKAADILHTNGFTKAYIKNYIPSLDKDEYIQLYKSTKVSKKLLGLTPDPMDKGSD
ncbi:MAG: hypothetical protein IJX12_06850 [Lachnospiraceae bacterium]|nr:hypothetical protein [Lachnospiraceae bacterium]